MSLIEIIAVCLLVFAIGEAMCWVLISWLRCSCPWLIMGQDRNPSIDEKGLKSFIDHGWDPKLGWIRKPNTAHPEVGKGGITTSYQIGPEGARCNPGFDDRPFEVLAYGDSYTFGRQVNDDETWAHNLSKHLNLNVGNFGVGNYGLDQALIRLEREFSEQPTKIIIMGVVPETISRIHSTWKHFSEYGNTFAFKPRYILQGTELIHVPNLIDTPEKILQLPEYFEQLAANDYFYSHKFNHDILTFPYLFSLACSWRRNIYLIAAALSDQFELTKSAVLSSVMARNVDFAARLFRDENGQALFKAVCNKFQVFCRDNNAVPILVMMPQLMDLKRIKSGDHYYKFTLDALSESMTVVDLAPALITHQDIASLFIDDVFGGHFSKEGNALVADILKPICEKHLPIKPKP